MRACGRINKICIDPACERFLRVEDSEGMPLTRHEKCTQKIVKHKNHFFLHFKHRLTRTLTLTISTPTQRTHRHSQNTNTIYFSWSCTPFVLASVFHPWSSLLASLSLPVRVSICSPLYELQSSFTLRLRQQLLRRWVR